MQLCCSSGHFRLPKAVAGTIKVSSMTKSRAVAILSKMSEDTQSGGQAAPVPAAAPSPAASLHPAVTAKDSAPKKRSHEQGRFTLTT